MGLLDIFRDVKNKDNQNDPKDQKNLPQLKKGPQEKIGIKSILREYNKKIKDNNDKAEKIIHASVTAEILMNKLINPAFEKLRQEFEEDGEERKAEFNFKEPQSILTVFCNNSREYIFKVTLKNAAPAGYENDFQLNAITYHFNSAGELSNGKEERILSDKKITKISEEDIRNDFYTKYRDYLLSRE
jgi:hypothetical protein